MMRRSPFGNTKPKPRRPAKQWTADELPGPRVPGQVLRIDDGKARMVVPIPKHTYLRSEPYKRWVASLACAHCGRPGPSQAAHSDRGADGKGMGIKAGDDSLWPGCADSPGRQGCHSIVGSTGTFKREHAQAVAAAHIAKTKAEAIATGNWPKGWPA
jgi:hypothetical protein